MKGFVFIMRRTHHHLMLQSTPKAGDGSALDIWHGALKSLVGHHVGEPTVQVACKLSFSTSSDSAPAYSFPRTRTRMRAASMSYLSQASRCVNLWGAAFVRTCWHGAQVMSCQLWGRDAGPHASCFWGKWLYSACCLQGSFGPQRDKGSPSEGGSCKVVESGCSKLQHSGSRKCLSLLGWWRPLTDIGSRRAKYICPLPRPIVGHVGVLLRNSLCLAVVDILWLIPRITWVFLAFYVASFLTVFLAFYLEYLLTFFLAFYLPYLLKFLRKPSEKSAHAQKFWCKGLRCRSKWSWNVGAAKAAKFWHKRTCIMANVWRMRDPAAKYSNHCARVSFHLSFLRWSCRCPARFSRGPMYDAGYL